MNRPSTIGVTAASDSAMNNAVMYQGLRIAVVIPAFCEAARVADVVRGLPSWVDRIIVVDDASTDGTADAAAAVQDERLLVLRHEQNQGVGGATMTGFNKASEEGADVLVKMDGDGQMDPGGLAALLAPIQRGEADYTKGNRFLHERQLWQMPPLRRLGNIAVSFMAKLASGYWNVFDPANGYVAIHTSVWRLLDQTRLARRFFFENSVLLELGLARAVVRDVYLPARYNDKVSHLSESRAAMEFPWLLLAGCLRRVWLQYFVRDFTAVSLFLIAGVGLSLFGAVWSAWHWSASARAGVATPTGTVMIGVLPLILGVQLLLQAVVMDVQNVPAKPVQSSLGL